MTGLVLVTSIMKNPDIDVSLVDNGGKLTSLAFGQIPYVGPILLTVGIITFAFSTVLGWAYYGERCVEYIGGKKVLIVYRIIYIAVAVIAPVSALNLVWTIADILNALMSIPNLIAVLLLSGIIVSDTRKYIDNLDAWDEEPVPVVDDHGNEINVPVDTTLMK
jgi:AGCS family alanine or glycine:cation symporter